MSRVVIVARTRMHEDRICIGGHDLDRDFRGLRLLDKFGGHLASDLPFMVGETWAIDYVEKQSARRPHVEDVCVMGSRRIGQVDNLKELVLGHARLWTGDATALFEGTVRATNSGSGYIPARGRLPRCSTGYWVPNTDLEQHPIGGKVRFELTGDGDVTRFAWVGVERPPRSIEAGSLIRVSLTRLFNRESTPEGYYVQISGVL